MTPHEPDDNAPGTAEELLRLLEGAGLGPRQRHAFVFRPAALLSGLVPGVAITDPATAARARKATARFIARLPEPIPAGVRLTRAGVRDAGTYMLELDFAWPGGTAVRHWDAEPYLNASRAHEPLLNDYARFADLRISDGDLAWSGDLTFAARFLYGESWTPDDGSVSGRPTR